jgi:hypothetical protein
MNYIILKNDYLPLIICYVVHNLPIISEKISVYSQKILIGWSGFQVKGPGNNL